jgi:hypothetical protein
MLKEKFDKIVKSFSKEVSKEILAGKYEVVSREASRISLKCLGESFDVWINSGCHVWAIKLGCNYYTDTRYDLGAEVREKLLKLTEEEKEAIKGKIEKVKERLEKLLKEGR